MRRVLHFIVAAVFLASRINAADPDFREDFTAIFDPANDVWNVHPAEWKSNPEAMAARARLFEDAANRVAKRLNIDVGQLLDLPLEQQIVESPDLARAVILALALGHAGDDGAMHAGLRLLISRKDPPNYLSQSVPMLLLLPLPNEEVWGAATRILNEGSSSPIGLNWLAALMSPSQQSVERISAALEPESVDPISLVFLAGAIEHPMVASPGQPLRLAEDAPREIPEPILSYISNNWREIPPFAGWISARPEVPRETRDEAIHHFLQWRIDDVAWDSGSGERIYASSCVHQLFQQDDDRKIVEDALAKGQCSESMAQIVMEHLEGKKATKIRMEENPDLAPVRE